MKKSKNLRNKESPLKSISTPSSPSPFLMSHIYNNTYTGLNECKMKKKYGPELPLCAVMHALLRRKKKQLYLWLLVTINSIKF